jgi:hypothetical protein
MPCGFVRRGHEVLLLILIMLLIVFLRLLFFGGAYPGRYSRVTMGGGTAPAVVPAQMGSRHAMALEIGSAV